MVVLSALAAQLSFSSHLRLQATATVGQGAQALYMARAGVEKAISDLVTKRDGAQPAANYLESESVPYANVPLGEGTWTLLAGYGETSRPLFGIMDESAKINLLTADASLLGQVPGLTPQLAAEIVQWRPAGQLRSLNDLLLVEGIDVQLLYGEDVNGNGLLDPNEDDGEESWPPDNADGRLDQGLAAYLTLWSAARNVTSEGKKRANLASASADDLMKAIPGLKSEEADSIVAQRGKKAFASIADLLDVPLAAKGSQAPQSPPKSGETGADQPQSAAPPANSAAAKPAEQPSSSQNQQEPAQMIIDQNRLREIADYVSLTGDETLKGLVNINTASAQVLACLPGMSEETAAAAVRWRDRQKDGFKSVADLLDVEGMTVDRFKMVCPYVSARSDVFSVHSFGVVQNGEVCRCVEAVMDRTGNAVRIVQRRELD